MSKYINTMVLGHIETMSITAKQKVNGTWVIYTNGSIVTDKNGATISGQHLNGLKAFIESAYPRWYKIVRWQI